MRRITWVANVVSVPRQACTNFFADAMPSGAAGARDFFAGHICKGKTIDT